MTEKVQSTKTWFGTTMMNIPIAKETSQNIRGFLHYSYANVKCMECQTTIPFSFDIIMEKVKSPKTWFGTTNMKFPIIIETSQNLRGFLYYWCANIKCVECWAIILHGFGKMIEKVKSPKTWFGTTMMNIPLIKKTSQNLRGFLYY